MPSLCRPLAICDSPAASGERQKAESVRRLDRRATAHVQRTEASSPGTVAIIFLVRRRHRSGDLRRGVSGEQAKLPVNHSPKFAPVLHPTLQTGVETMMVATGACCRHSVGKRYHGRPSACAWSDGHLRLRAKRGVGGGATAFRRLSESSIASRFKVSPKIRTSRVFRLLTVFGLHAPFSMRGRCHFSLAAGSQSARLCHRLYWACPSEAPCDDASSSPISR
jgi:hypothetical protein